jgi:SAM-dependent methyltransferase
VGASPRTVLRRLLTADQLTRIERLRKRVRARPPVGRIRFGSLRRVTPLDRAFGATRGTPIDRYYIEKFLSNQAGLGEYIRGDIHGRVLEIGGADYTRRFGGWNGRPSGKVSASDVLDPDPGNSDATIVGDLTQPEKLPAEAYDCVICTQVILFIYDIHTAIRALHQMLRPGGVLLLTVGGVSQICHPDADLWGDYWRFTSLSVRRLAEEVFDAQNVTVRTYGNVLAASAFLYGAAAEDLKQWELDSHDPDYEVTIALRAVKSSGRPRSHPT